MPLRLSLRWLRNLVCGLAISAGLAAFTFSINAQTGGPGGPILVVSSPVNPFSQYYAEILRAEGLNAFGTSDIGSLSAEILTNYDVVILGEVALNASQVTLLTNWVNTGGNLIAMRPDKQLASLLGLTDASATLAEGYLLVDTSVAPGLGIVGQTMQFHGTADRYTLSGATEVARLYSTSADSTSNPAVTINNVGGSGGQAAAFTYDLARSVVYTRQGNPAWSGQERDGVTPIRSDDLFFGGAAPNYVDLSKVAIPQADEQQRLLANLILHLNADRRPIPRFWYFPRNHKAVIVMTGDDHSQGGTAGRFDSFNSVSPAGCSVADWECIRGTSYIYATTPLTDAAAAAYKAQGFEIAAHINTNCADFTPTSINSFIPNAIAGFSSVFPSLMPLRTNRTHCVVWSDYDSQAQAEGANGIRFDTNYYYFPAAWVNNTPGLFTGSGMPMRFAKADGTMIDVYQATTQMTDESGQTFPFTSDTLLDRALGPLQYFGAFVANMHTDEAFHAGSAAIVASAQARGVPVVSSAQMLDWLDGRNNSTMADITWNAGTSVLTFTVTAASGAHGLQTSVPVKFGGGVLTNVLRNSVDVPYTLETIKGIAYARFSSDTGSYAAQYAPDNSLPVITNVTATPGTDSATIEWWTDEPATSRVDYGTSPAFDQAFTDPSLTTSHSVVLPNLLSGVTYYYRVTSADSLGNSTTWPAPPAAAASFTMPGISCPCSLWPDSQTPAVANSGDTSPIELGMKFRATVAGSVTAIRFYKGPLNTGIHTGSLWTAGGALLSTVTFTGESSAGWQQMMLPAPIPITANTTYVVSYHTDTGQYAANIDYFQTTVSRGPLQGLADGLDGGNGVFAYGASAFPTNSFNKGNYWVDLLFQPAAADATAPTVTSLLPANGSTNVPRSAAVTATFSENVNAATVTGATFELRNSAGALVPAAVSYNSITHLATLQPSSALAAGASYTARVVGGAAGVRDHTGNALVADVTSGFTTADDVAPTVTGTTPTDGAISVSPATTVTATFSEAMNASTVTTSTVVLRDPGNNIVPATVGYNAGTHVMTLTPSASLAQSAMYTATVVSGASGVKDLAGNALAADFVWSFTTADLTPPTITARSPLSGATTVPLNTTVTVTFSEPMNASTVTTSTVILRDPGNNVVPATVGYNAGMATLTPSSSLSELTTYTATVVGGAPGVKDVAGNQLAADSAWSFTTADLTVPTISTRTPANGATAVSPSTTVTVTFSEAMNASTITTSTVELRDPGNNVVAAAVDYNLATFVATLTPNAPLPESTTYTATVVGGASGVKDLAGNALSANSVWSFTTADLTAPTITSRTPVDGATAVSPSTAVTVTFSEALNASTITTSTVELRDAGSNVVPAAVSYNSETFVATLTPNATLAEGTTYTATVVGGGSGVKDPAGNALAADSSWSFTIADLTAPTIPTRDPVNGATAVSPSTTVTVTFSEAMNASTITTSTIELRDAGNNVVPAAVSYNSETFVATLTPNASLTESTTYTATVVGGSAGVKDPAGNALASDSSWSFTTGDVTAPAIVVRTPPNGAIAVALNTTVTVTFSEAMNASTITTSTVVLRDPGNNVVPAAVGYDGGTHVATLTPSAPLAEATTYTATVVGGGSGVKDLAGLALAADAAASFTTVDLTAPTVLTIVPADGAFGILPAATVVVTFSESMDPASVTTASFTLHDASSSQVAATVSYNALTHVATLTPSSPLAVLTSFTVTVVGGASGVKDASGNALATTFTSGFSTADITAPMVTSVVPAAGASGVPRTSAVVVTFSEPMDPLTITAATIELRDPSNAVVSGTLTYDDPTRTATLQPSAALAAAATFALKIKGGPSGIKDPAGNPLVGDITQTFTTAGAPAIGTSARGRYGDLSTDSATTSAVTTQASTNFVVYVHGEGGTSEYPTLTDSYDNVWTPRAVRQTSAWPAYLWIYTSFNAEGGPGHTFTASKPNGSYPTILVTEVLGSNVAVADLQVGVDNVTPYATPSVSVSTDALLLGAFAPGFPEDFVTITPGNGFGTLVEEPQGDGAWVASLAARTAAAGTYEATWTMAGGIEDFDFGVALIVLTGTPFSDVTAPALESLTPSDGSAGPISASIRARFNEPLDPATVHSSTFELRDASSALVPAVVSYDSTTRTAVLKPVSPLVAGQVYNVRIFGGSPGMKDLASNPLVADVVGAFTASDSPSLGASVKGRYGDDSADAARSLRAIETQAATNLVVYVHGEGGNSDFPVITDTYNNTWTPVAVQRTSSWPGFLWTFVSLNATGGPGHRFFASKPNDSYQTTLTVEVLGSNVTLADTIIGFDNDSPYTTGAIQTANDALLLGAFAPSWPGSTIVITPGNGFATVVEETNGDGAWVESVASRTVLPGSYTASWTKSGGEDDFDFGVHLMALKFGAGEPAISISDLTVSEPASGTSNASFAVTLSQPSLNTVTVNYSTIAGTAASGGDFAPVTGTITFPAGVTALNVQVPIVADSQFEGNETFGVSLSGAVNATFTRPYAVGTIHNTVPPTVSIADASVAEGNSGTTNLSFVVSLSAALVNDVSVSYAVSPGTATDGIDFTSAAGTLTIPAGTNQMPLVVAVAGDASYEPDETVTVALSNPVGIVISSGQATGTIVNDDAVPSASISGTTVTEGNAANSTVELTVSLSAASAFPATLHYTTSPQSAAAASDYVSASGDITIPAGSTTATISVQVIGDLLDESDETFDVILSNPGNATVGTGTGTVTINDDDEAPTVQIANDSAVEGDAGTSAGNLTVTLSSVSGRTVTVEYAMSDGSASSADYTAATGTLTFAPGVTSLPVPVSIIGDTIDEANETVIVTISAPTNAVLGTAQGTLTINDDDASPAIQVSDTSVTETNAGTTPAVLTVSLSVASEQTVTVQYATANGTADSTDYATVSGTLTFAPGVTSLTITVDVAGDLVSEADETVLVNLSNVSNATLPDNQGTITIDDDDAVPALSIGSQLTIAEGSGGTTNAQLTVTLSEVSGQVVTVAYTTNAATAVAGADFTTTSGTLSIPAGATTGTITVPIATDLMDEADETLTVDLSNPSGASLTTAQAVITITDDDEGPSVLVADVTVTEGNTGTAAALITVTLSGPSGKTVTVEYSTADGTAISDDYVSASGTLTFAPGVTSQQASVNVNGDLLDEPGETFEFNLANAQNASIGDDQAIVTISDDDPTPSLTIADLTVVEGNTGTSDAVLTVTLSAASGQAVAVNYTTTAGTAAAGTDYTTTSGTLTIPAGSTSATITVPIVGDTVTEVTEAFTVDMSGAVNATVADASATVAITDNDQPTMSINSVTVTEGNTGSQNVTLNVSLSGASTQVITASWSTANQTAVSGSDYTAVASGTVTFPAGSVSQNIVVVVLGDTLDEANETFAVNLVNPVNAVLGTAQGVVTITDNDASPSITITNGSVTEGNTGTVNVTLTVSLSAASGQIVTVQYATADNSATNPADYAAASGTVTFNPGTTTQTLTFQVAGDVLDEANETFNVNLSAAVNATISDALGVVTITDNDATPSLIIDNGSITEGDSGSQAVVLTVTLSVVSGRQVTVNYATQANTATTADYTTSSGTLTFAPGVTTQTVSVNVTGDLLSEATESFNVVLSTATNATIADATGVISITDNGDPQPVITIANSSTTESNGGTKNMTFTATLSFASGQPVSFSYATADGTATTANNDYTAKTGTVTFGAGATSQTFTVTIRGDNTVEPNETFFVNASAPVAATLGTTQATGTITNDD